MKIVEPSVEIIDEIDGEKILKKLEICGRTCYQSEPKGNSAEDFIRNIIKRGHESVLEHISITARFICSRACSHQLVRHRLASFSQESMRFCAYNKDRFGNEITVIKPRCFKDVDFDHMADIKLFANSSPRLYSSYYSVEKYDKRISEAVTEWQVAQMHCEESYFNLINGGYKPEDARGVLSQDTKTTVVMTANLREWRHVFNMRCDSHAQAEIRELCTDLLKQMHDKIPAVFDDKYDKFIDKLNFKDVKL